MTTYTVRVSFYAEVEAPNTSIVDRKINHLIDKLGAVDTSPIRWDDVDWYIDDENGDIHEGSREK